MRIFLAGDHYSGTGPANVTKYYIENLPEGTLFQKARGKIARVPEILINTIRADVVVYSGYSKQNLLGMRLAKMLKRPCAYIMHGCVEYENEINLEPDEEMSAVERQVLGRADLILAVSERFCAFLKERYPEYSDKTDHVTNGIDTTLRNIADDRKDVDPHMIFSIGGGMPRKKIGYICEAVKILRRDYDPKLYLCVIGDKGADTDLIDSYDFVENLGIVPFEKTKQLFAKAALFVQNSCFETFGLAPVEALSCGCPILCSDKVGALDIIGAAGTHDVIEHFDDACEIADKIRYLLENPNAERLVSSIEWEKCSWKARSMSLQQKLSELVLRK